MNFFADLHLHSKYSRAVSGRMVITEMAQGAKRKGIKILASGDWTHPSWFKELQANLVEKKSGLYVAKNDPDVYFLLSTEISSIYSQGGKGRRIHNLIFAPTFEVAGKINEALKNWGANLLSDGRPIIGLPARDLAELVFSINREAMIIPAHIWTPWFSLYGANSGFDSIDDAFGEFAKNIFAVETGLSSDPSMNWRIPELDSRSILSFSDAHSLEKIGREATVFNLAENELSYQTLTKAIKVGKIASTIEFFPEEGKYHFSGHRSCHVRQSPEETKAGGVLCPVCKKKLTLGVMHRVEELAKRPEGYLGVNRPPYKRLVPLYEILAQAIGVSTVSKKIQEPYQKLLDSFGSELNVLTMVPEEEITCLVGERIAQGITRVREGKICIEPGYDGVYGLVKIWKADTSLF